MRPTYFLSPPRPYPPSGPIRLGAVIPSHTLPDEPLYIPPSLEPSSVNSYTEKNWKHRRIHKSSARFGLWTSFLQMLAGPGADVNVQKASTIKKYWDAKEMRTESFQPTTDFLNACVEADEVRKYVVRNRFLQKIYIITGIMIASCSRSLRTALEVCSVYIHAGVDATVLTGVPISGGPEGICEAQEKIDECSEREEEYVFAFQLCEVKVKRDGTIRTFKRHDKGALFSVDDDGNELDESTEPDKVASVELDEQMDIDRLGLDVKKVRNEDSDAEGDDDECLCVMPELEGFEIAGRNDYSDML